MEILLIRHFMTRGNAEHRYIGITDEALLPGQTSSYPEVQAVFVTTDGEVLYSNMSGN